MGSPELSSWTRWLSLGLGLGLGLPGCVRLPLLGEVETPSPLPASAQAPQLVISPHLPFELSTRDDYVVRLVAGRVTCSGTLVDNDRVLTAHHCVAARSARGEILGTDVDPSEVRVELGGQDLPWGEVNVRTIVAPTCGHAAGSGDIAILVLEHPLVGLETARARIDQAPTLKETISPIGFGRCALSTDGLHRRKRPMAHIEALSDATFRADAAICPGDSGGPVLDRAGEVVGVISAAVMDADETSAARAEFTRLDRFRALFARAEAVARGQSLAELPPVDCDH